MVSESIPTWYQSYTNYFNMVSEPSFLGLNSSATPPPSAQKFCPFSHAPPQSSNHIESHFIRQIFRRSSQICPENLLPTIHALSHASRSSCRFLTRSTRCFCQSSFAVKTRSGIIIGRSTRRWKLRAQKPSHALLRASPDDNLLHAPPHAATNHLFQTRPPDPCSKAADLLDAAMNTPPTSAKRFHAPLSTLLFSWAHLSNLYLRHTKTQPVGST